MSERISRRQLLSIFGTTSVTGAVGAAAATSGWFTPTALADLASRKNAPAGVDVDVSGVRPCTLVDGHVVQPQKNLNTTQTTDVLVVGAGPAGCVAAVAAARAGAKVTLVERYGHFGGLSTGGLVLVILGHWVTGKKQVCQGLGEEIMSRLDKIDRGIVNRRQGVNPTVDAEALKYVLLEMIVEAGVDVFLHSWAEDAVMDGKTIRGIAFQSKSGRQAILAKQVVDTTGAGDIFAAAGAEHQLRKYHIGLPYRIGNLDKVDKTKTQGQRPPRGRGSVTPIEGVNWVNMHGPDGNGVDVRTLSALEIKHRQQIWKQVEAMKKVPGYEEVYLMETAPQMGVRVSRVIDGTADLTVAGVRSGKKFDDCVAIGGAWRGDHREWQIPYGAMVSRNIDNLITAGRSIDGEPAMSDLIRVIPNCWVTGHAAGCAAAVAAKENCESKKVDLEKVRKVLKEQKAYLG